MATLSLAVHTHDSARVEDLGRHIHISLGSMIFTISRGEAARLAADLCEALGAHSLVIADNALPPPLAAAVTHGSQA